MRCYIISFVKNPSRIIISIALIFAFSATLIFCCAFQDAQASAVDHGDHDQAEHGLAQSDKADHQHDSHSSQDCMCQQIFAADLNKSFNPDLASAHFFKRFFKNDTMLGRSLNLSSLNHSSLLPERSPPLIAAVSIPIYLKNSRLRL